MNPPYINSHSNRQINAATGLPSDWTIRISRTHDYEYYFNKKTNESSWLPPVNTDKTKLEKYLSKSKHRPEKIWVRHILIKHKYSRNPKSWREDKITRTKDIAFDKLSSYKDEIERGDVTLKELAIDNSDCNSHLRGGDLGFIKKGELQPSFERTSFLLQVGELSGIIESDSGLHLIERIG